MAAAFSSLVVSRDHTGDHNDQLARPPSVTQGFHLAHAMSNPCSAIELIRPLITTIVHHRSVHATHPFMEPQRMGPMRP